MADRKPDSYLGSATGAVAEAEVTAVVFEDSLYQGKAQARANGFGGEKGIGYVFKDRCADTTTGIENRQGHAVLLRRDFQGQGWLLAHLPAQLAVQKAVRVPRQRAAFLRAKALRCACLHH